MAPKDAPLGKPQETKSYAGGPVRKTSRVRSGKSISEIFIDMQKRLGINLLWKPFEDETTELNRFVKAFLMQATGGVRKLKRVENLLQAVVRNPILRLEYGSNKASTADNKGFDRLNFDTGQTFKAIKAKAKRV